MSTATDGAIFSNLSPGNTAAFGLKGGTYGITVSATFGGGNVQLQTLAIDGTTWLAVGASITAVGLTSYILPAGQYRLSITAATSV